jgi:hypothetical protein
MEMLDLSNNCTDTSDYYTTDIAGCFSAAVLGNIAASKTVTELNLASNGIKANDIAQFCQHLEGNITLTKLDLSGNPGLLQVDPFQATLEELRTFEAPGVLTRGLNGVLVVNTTIKYLDITHCQLNSDSAARLAPALKANSTIQVFSFCGNGGVDGTEGDPVKIDTNSTTLDFGGRKLGRAGVLLFGALLPRCRWVCRQFNQFKPQHACTAHWR